MNSEIIVVEGVEFNMVDIPGGEFLMGSPEDEYGRYENEEQRFVKVPSFWMADTLTTQALWQIVMGENPSYFKNEDTDPAIYPVEQISWYDCQDFIERLNELVPGGGFRLPTEEEWEYACRAGTTTPFWTGETITTEQANFDGHYPYRSEDSTGEYRQRTTPVKLFEPNPWGLYDMHGNLWEWTNTLYIESTP